MARFRDWLLRGFLTLWLGVAMPLLCIPGVSSNHTHGSHWVWAEPEEPSGGHAQDEEQSHTHSHSHTHGSEDAPAHSHEPPAPSDPAPPLRARVSQPTLTRAPGESVQSALANAVGIPTAHFLLPWPLSQRALDGTPADPPPAPPVLRPWRPPPTL